MMCVARMDDLLAVSAAERRFTLILRPRLEQLKAQARTAAGGLAA